MFGFDERFAMFDITPVENLFILEYLPSAKGDYVRVYLYGLMHCYHPEQDMNLDRMSHELNMTQEEVLSAFRYWERRRLVRRISDKPPKWQYVNLKQIMQTDDEPEDAEYKEFSSALYEAFDNVRRLHGSELNTCFEWHEQMGLPTEVIIMLIRHMVEIKGKNFRIAEADKTAVRMAEEKICTVEAAEDFFSRDGRLYKGIRNILKKMGKSYSPSEAQVNLYRKWIVDWQFSPEAIEAALELTAKGDPSLGYLDGILNGLRQEAGPNAALTPETIRLSGEKTDGLREVIRKIGRGEVSQRNLKIYEEMRTLYPQEVLLIAAAECGQSGKGIDEVLKLLQSWKEKGLDRPQDVEEYVRSFHDQTALIRELRHIWGTDESRAGKTDRSLVSKWQGEYGFSRDMILFTARYASEAKSPMSYLDRILTNYHDQGIRTPQEAEKDRENGKTVPSGNRAKTVSAQQYEQRDYQGIQDQMMQAQRKRIEDRLRENGGETDA